jgi:hypothetical protein
MVVSAGDMNTINEISPFLHINDIASIVADYLKPLTPSCKVVKRFVGKLQGAIKRILLKGIDKTVIKNNKLKIKIEICNSGNILINITSQHHAVFLGEILNMGAGGDILYEGSDEIETIGSIYDKDIRKISKFIKNNIHFILYLKYVEKTIEMAMQ